MPSEWPDHDDPCKWVCASCDYTTETSTRIEVRCPTGCTIKSGEQAGKPVVLYQTNISETIQEFGE